LIIVISLWDGFHLMHWSASNRAIAYIKRRSFLPSQEFQPSLGAMRFAQIAAQIVIQTGLAAKLLPANPLSHKAKAAVAHIAYALAVSFYYRGRNRHQRTKWRSLSRAADPTEINTGTESSQIYLCLNLIC
jgi:hypothetical protein